MSFVEEALRKLDLAQKNRLEQQPSDGWPTPPLPPTHESAFPRKALIILILGGLVVILGFMLIRAQTPSRVEPLAISVASGTTVASPVPQMSTLPAATPPALDAAVAKKNVTEALMQWADTWSRRDVGGYMAFYSEKFDVPDGLTRANWEAQRQVRIRTPQFIQVTLKEMQVRMADDGSATVNFIQDYAASNYREIGANKEIRLHEEGGKWRIFRESQR